MPFQKGQSGNPNGRPSGRQAFIDRASKFLWDYTIDELLALVRDKEKFGALSVMDGMIVSRLARAISKADGADIDKILDRVIGKPTQPAEVEQQVTLSQLINGNFQE
jgi:hypothetical protein